MTQSKKNDITIDIDDLIDKADEFTIDLNTTYGTTTTYWAGSTMTDSITITDDIISTINLGNYTLSGDFGNITLDTSWHAIYPDDVDRMCKEYPALEKVWRNFKSMYDIVKQDYEGKKQAGEIDDDIPF